MNIEDILGTSSYYFSGIIFGTAFVCIIYFFYLYNLFDLLKAIREPNRRMAPGGVWLILLNAVCAIMRIPIYSFAASGNMKIAYSLVVLTYLLAIFTVIWHFKIVRAVADSIEAEFDSRNIPVEYRPTYQTGMFMAVSAAVSLIREVPYISMLGVLGAVTFFVGMLVYWRRTYKFRKEIKQLPEYHDEDSLVFKDLY